MDTISYLWITQNVIKLENIANLKDKVLQLSSAKKLYWMEANGWGLLIHKLSHFVKP